ncbi:hypothetical protein Syn6312_2974 [Synechococcus sp. PCC 6312]|nr:hypothetical protein Syn6312_2974 [Synechococcus sp. PCC 6312]
MCSICTLLSRKSLTVLGENSLSTHLGLTSQPGSAGEADQSKSEVSQKFAGVEGLPNKPESTSVES